MSYSDFTLQTIVKELQLVLNERTNLFAQIPESTISDHLAITLKENVPLALAINTEKARSELIIAVMLVELRKVLNYQVSLFSGVELNVDPPRGLHGVCDFIIARSPEQLFIRTPAMVIVEAKNENIKGGLGRCIAAMLAARLFNAQEDQPISTVYGAVTSGSVWKFLQLTENTVYIDLEEYYINNAGKILGILIHRACRVMEVEGLGQRFQPKEHQVLVLG